MIEEIYIRDLGVISEARLEFGSGLTVLTGETGAGKTMVLSALGLLLGERSDSAAVRRGQDSAFVEGRWLIPAQQSIYDRISEVGGQIEDGELILNRSVSSEGRSKASAAGRAVPVSLLSELGEQLVVVHGQSDQIRLKSATAQREALDGFGGAAVRQARETYGKAFEAHRAAELALEELERNAQNQGQVLAELNAASAEFEAIDPQPDELTAVTERIMRLTHVEELRSAVSAAHEALSSESFQDAPDALGLVGLARKQLESASSHDGELAKHVESLALLGSQLNDVTAELAGYLGDLDSVGLQEIDQLQERRSALSALAKKYGPDYEEMLAYRVQVDQRLLDFDFSPQKLHEARTSVAGLLEVLQSAADELTHARKLASAALESQVNAELAGLAMGGARIEVQVAPGENFASHGRDAVSILLTSYQGAEPRPLGKGASGGELSRIMLAIEVVLAKTSTATTFIFDEVDAGVGGAAAIEVGKRLAQLAKTTQVIVVTHLAQVAAFADRHLRVLKSTADEFTSTDVISLAANERITELTRMLSGLEDSDSGRAHAAELIELAGKI